MTKPDALIYPFTSEPGTGDGSAVEIADGVLWLRMPLFAALPWINVWAVADGAGWCVVDTGLKSEPTADAWRAALAGPLQGKPVTRVLVTHMHPDHCGMAGWFGESFAAPLWMSRLEYLTCRLMASDTGRTAPQAGVDFYRAAGWDEPALRRYQEKFGFFGEMIHPLPAAYRRLADGEVVALGARRFEVVVGSGHSPEHACLYEPNARLFISGDQVLPRITSNVSVYPTEPDADPLEDWLRSLRRLKQRVPDDVLVLPAHNSPFRGLHARLDALLQGHAQSLDKVAALLHQPRRAIDVFGALFSREITPGLLGMATGEAVAHLNHLEKLGRARREPREEGVWWWSALP